MNPIMGALRFFYGTTLDQKQFEQITFARKVRLPAVLTRDEVVAFLKAVGDLKMSTAFITIYAAGPRVSEVVARSAADIDSKGMVICVRQGKGRKDRYVMLALLQEMVAKLCLSMCTVTDLSRPAVGAVACRPARLYWRLTCPPCGSSPAITPRTLRRFRANSGAAIDHRLHLVASTLR